jgi:hypothetical protein
MAALPRERVSPLIAPVLHAVIPPELNWGLNWGLNWAAQLGALNRRLVSPPSL